MSLADVVRASAERSFDLYAELAATLTREQLGSHLSNVRSNTVGEQLWCVVGARESYSRGIRAGKWAGFACSLTSACDQRSKAKLIESRSCSRKSGFTFAAKRTRSGGPGCSHTAMLIQPVRNKKRRLVAQAALSIGEGR